MKIRLTLRNVLPEIVVRKRDPFGQQTEDDLTQQPVVAAARAGTIADPFSFETIHLQLEQFPPDVYEIVLRLKVFNHEFGEPEWTLEHQRRFLHGCRYTLKPEAARAMHLRIPERCLLTPDAGAIVTFERGPIEFARQYPHAPGARRWTIYDQNKASFGRRCIMQVSEAEADVVYSGDPDNYPF